MTSPLSMTRWSGACAGLLLLTIATFGASAVGPKHLLILLPLGHNAAPFSDVAGTFRTTLAREFGEPHADLPSAFCHPPPNPDYGSLITDHRPQVTRTSPLSTVHFLPP